MPRTIVAAVVSHRALVAVVVAAVAVTVTVLSLVGSAGRAAADTGPWQWPLSPAPEVVQPARLPTEPWLPGHRGVDLAASVGSPVLAAGTGTVSFAGVVVDRGVVVVTHGALRTTYEPVDPQVTRGDVLAPGAQLGVLSAVPGHCAPRPCLHWGLRRGETYLDPLLLVQPRHARLLPVWRDRPAAAPAASAGWVERGTGDAALGLIAGMQPPVLTAAGVAVMAAA